MDEHTTKRAFGSRPSAAARRGPSLAFRDTSNYKDRSVQCCNRLGCSTGFNSTKSSQAGTSDMPKNSKPSFRTTSSKSITGSSSKKYSAVRDLKKPYHERHEAVSALETTNPEVETELLKGISSSVNIETVTESEDVPPRPQIGSSADKSEEVESRRIISSTRNLKQIRDRSEMGNHDMLSSSRRSFTSKTINQATISGTYSQRTNEIKYGLRNLGCTSISDVFPARRSSSHLSSSKKAEVTKRSLDGDSSFRGKISRPSSRESLGNHKSSLSHNYSRSEFPSSQTSRIGNRPLSKDSVASVRTRTVNGGNSARISGPHKGNCQAVAPTVPPKSPQTKLSISGSSAASSSHLSRTELPSIHRNSFGRTSGGNINTRNQLTAHTEEGTGQSFPDLPIDQDGFEHSNMDDINEVLFALEMIGQDQELTDEHLYFLESNLLLGGISFYDQHRDMRLDIDNMSYEELLALEEKMGTVSTALTEEALSNCVKKSCYTSAHSFVGKASSKDYDIKCSVCQEEYAEGDKLGKLSCDHGYHLLCIQQWLRQKNWCPICKSPASTS